MSNVSRLGLKTALLCWLPVMGMVVALFVVPSSTGAGSAPPPLRVTPGSNTYGGQRITFSGDIGNGVQRIRLQRRDRLASPWGTVIDPRTGRAFSTLTRANGSFEFDFPAPAMNGTYFRVASGQVVTQAHQFVTVQQDVDISLIELTPADVPLPRGLVVASEGFRIAADTVDHDRFGKPTKRILPGRLVTLQVRSGDGWKDEETANVGRDGWLDFGDEIRRAPTGSPEVFRVVMENWTQDGDRIGWMPSLPFYLDVVRRPDPVRLLESTATASSVRLSWTLLPVDPERHRIVIARTAGAGAPPPTAGTERHIIATIAGGATSYTDNTVRASATFKYAVYTVSDDGVYNAVPERLTVLTPAAKRGVS